MKTRPTRFSLAHLLALGAALVSAGAIASAKDKLHEDNPVRPLPEPPVGAQVDFSALKFRVTPEKVRLGRWLFFDKRLSKDGTIACASCHRPENAFSEPTPHSTGVGGKTGDRKAPTFLNGAFPFYDVYFWDGRAGSLQEQAKGPMVNPIEMATEHDVVVKTVASKAGYRAAFKEIHGVESVDIDKVADAIAAYEATRISAGSRWDRWKAGEDVALLAAAKKGDELFFGKAQCAQCHVGWNFTDSKFHNLGIGWDARAGAADPAKGFKDLGRAKVSGKPEDTGAFKTPTLRDVSKHAPYMHDGSVATLRDAVEHYNKGGNPNPWLSNKVKKLDLTPEEVDALVELMKALDGTGYEDEAPKSFPE